MNCKDACSGTAENHFSLTSKPRLSESHIDSAESCEKGYYGEWNYSFCQRSWAFGNPCFEDIIILIEQFAGQLHRAICSYMSVPDFAPWRTQCLAQPHRQPQDQRSPRSPWLPALLPLKHLTLTQKFEYQECPLMQTMLLDKQCLRLLQGAHSLSEPLSYSGQSFSQHVWVAFQQLCCLRLPWKLPQMTCQHLQEAFQQQTLSDVRPGLLEWPPELFCPCQHHPPDEGQEGLSQKAHLELRLAKELLWECCQWIPCHLAWVLHLLHCQKTDPESCLQAGLGAGLMRQFDSPAWVTTFQLIAKCLNKSNALSSLFKR